MDDLFEHVDAGDFMEQITFKVELGMRAAGVFSCLRSTDGARWLRSQAGTIRFDDVTTTQKAKITLQDEPGLGDTNQVATLGDDDRVTWRTIPK